MRGKLNYCSFVTTRFSKWNHAKLPHSFQWKKFLDFLKLKLNWYHTRIVGSSGKLKPEWSKIKRVAIVVVPGALVGLILASFYCGFRKADGIYVMQNILTGFIVLAIVLLLNFKNLGAAIVTIVIKSVSTVIFMNITYYHENSLFYHSLFLKPRNTAEKIPFCEKVIQNGKTVLFDCAESVFQEKSPFMFFFTFAVQECLCQVPLYFFNSMRQMLVAIMFAMFCLIYNEEHSSKPSVWFTISIIFGKQKFWSFMFFACTINPLEKKTNWNPLPITE